MHLPLPYYPLIAHWVPGFVTLSIVIYPLLKQNICSDISAGMAVIMIFFFTVLAFVIGQIIDAFRNSIVEEYLFNKWLVKKKCVADIDWISWAIIKNEKLDNLFFVYYAFDINFILSIIIGFIIINIPIINIPHYDFLTCCEKCLIILALLIISISVGKDARDIREEMKEIIDTIKLYKN